MAGCKLFRIAPFLFAVFLMLNYNSCFPVSNINEGEPPNNELDMAIDNLTDQIIKNISEQDKQKIAIIEFADLNGKVTQFGKYLSEELITRIYRTKKFSVVERQLLNKVIREQQLSVSGMVDPGSAREIGRILGVDAIVSGTVTDLGDKLKINARIISTESGEIFGVAATSLEKSPVVMNLMGESSPNKIVAKAAPENQNNSPVIKEKVVNDYRFELTGARLVDNTIHVDFVITNQALDREFRIYGVWGSRLFDNFGNEYEAANVALANKSRRNRITHLMVSNVPIEGALEFQKVDNNASKITLLEIAGYCKGKKMAAQFRNIAIERE
jgi:TolB-like protein